MSSKVGKEVNPMICSSGPHKFHACGEDLRQSFLKRFLMFLLWELQGKCWCELRQPQILLNLQIYKKVQIILRTKFQMRKLDPEWNRMVIIVNHFQATLDSCSRISIWITLYTVFNYRIALLVFRNYLVILKINKCFLINELLLTPFLAIRS